MGSSPISQLHELHGKIKYPSAEPSVTVLGMRGELRFSCVDASKDTFWNLRWICTARIIHKAETAKSKRRRIIILP